MQRFGRIEIRPAERQLLIDGAPAALGARAFDVLLALVERRDRVVNKAELIDLVWPGLVVEENNLQVQVSALRKLLGSNAIATVPGRGYRFIAPATAAEAAAALPASAAGNLPARVPPLIGRDAALRELLAAIDAHPLVNIVGAGGIGKTALALAAADALRERHRDGVWWVELAPLTDPRQLPQAIAQALRITLPADGDAAAARQRLVGVLQLHRLLLVLDNCEHLIDAVGELAQAIVAGAPDVRLLLTSQELLGLPAERVLRATPLSLPAAGETPSIEHGALALFVERARAADPAFALTDDNAAAMADICRRLDGLPLAIELAAARVRLLGVQALSERLDERFRLLGGARAALRRHQTLRATIDWSHALLKADEQAVLRRLGVFVGGCSLTLAQQVCADGDALDEWAVLDALGSLVDKSLVAADAGEPPRYRLLETTRLYALERLADAGETAATLRRHAHAVRELFVRADDERFGDTGTLDFDSLLRRLAPETDNWRAAFDWAAAAEPPTAVALAGPGAHVLRERGLSQEALDRLLPLRAAADSAELRHAAGFWLRLSWLGLNGRLPREVQLDAMRRCTALHRSLGQRRRLLVALCNEVRTLTELDQFDAAEAGLPEIVALERADDPAWLRAVRLNMQGVLRNHQARFADALALFGQMRELLTRAGGEAVLLGVCDNNLCFALNCLQRHAEALALASAALPAARERSAESYLYFQIGHACMGLHRFDDALRMLRDAVPAWRRDALLLHGGFLAASMLAVTGRLADAARVEGAALQRLRRAGARPHPLSQMSRDRCAAAFAGAGVAGDDLKRWRREGEGLDEAAIAAMCLSIAG